MLSSEPPSPNNPLLYAKNCVITPHVAWTSLPARQRLLRSRSTTCARCSSGAPVHVVNPDYAASHYALRRYPERACLARTRPTTLQDDADSAADVAPSTSEVRRFRHGVLSPARYQLTRFVFLRFLGLIYFVAFLALALQWRPLIGSDGLLARGRLSR